MNVLLVEDDRDLASNVGEFLEALGHQVDYASDGLQARALCTDNRYEAIILDVGLPGASGLDVCRWLRTEARLATPVIMLTAKTSEINVVSGLDSGADDYIPKPFSVIELIARIKAVLRRAGNGTTEETSTLRAGNIVLDEDRHTVTCNGEPVKLTLKEYELLQYFMTNTGLALSREKIMGAVWGFSFEGESRTVDMHVMTLRQRLGEEGKRLQTVRGIGYRWEGDA